MAPLYFIYLLRHYCYVSTSKLRISVVAPRFESVLRDPAAKDSIYSLYVGSGNETRWRGGSSTAITSVVQPFGAETMKANSHIHSNAVDSNADLEVLQARALSQSNIVGRKLSLRRFFYLGTSILLG